MHSPIELALSNLKITQSQAIDFLNCYRGKIKTDDGQNFVISHIQDKSERDVLKFMLEILDVYKQRSVQIGKDNGECQIDNSENFNNLSFYCSSAESDIASSLTHGVNYLKVDSAIQTYFEESKFFTRNMKQLVAVKNIEQALELEFGNDKINRQIIDTRFSKISESIKKLHASVNQNFDLDVELKKVDAVLKEYRAANTKFDEFSFVKRYLQLPKENDSECSK